MKELSEYDDYRDYFNDIFSAKKSKNKAFSYQYCALKLQVSRSYLKLIFTKARHISLEKLSEVSDFFELNLFHRQWITHLFLYNTCSDPEMKKYFRMVVDSYLSNQIRERENVDNFLQTKSQNSIFTNWLMMVISNLVDVVDFQWDADWIYQKIVKLEKVEKSDVKAAMKMLLDLKIIELSSSGSAIRKLSDKANHVAPWDLEEFSRFKLGQVKSIQAVEALIKGDMPSPGRFQLASFHINEEDIIKICKLYDELEIKIREISLASKKPTRVLMSSNNLFSLTRK